MKTVRKIDSFGYYMYAENLNNVIMRIDQFYNLEKIVLKAKKNDIPIATFYTTKNDLFDLSATDSELLLNLNEKYKNDTEEIQEVLEILEKCIEIEKELFSKFKNIEFIEIKPEELRAETINIVKENFDISFI